MATSGQVRTNEIDGGTYFYVNWQMTGQDQAGNYTTINWQHGVHCRWEYGSNGIQSYGAAIDNVDVYGGEVFSGLSMGDHELASGSYTINHNADGTKTFNIRTGGRAFVDPYYDETSGSQDFSLPTIPRYAVTNSVNGSNIESSFSVNYTKYVSSYTYKLRISIPDVVALETISYPTSGASFTLSDSSIQTIYDRFPNTDTFNLGFRIETWNGSTRLSEGNEVIKSCTKSPRVMRLRVNGEWKKTTPYVRVNGQWKKATPYIRKNNEWKRGK